MSAKTTKKTRGKAKGEAGTEEPRDAAQTCGCMPSGEMPDCCGPDMREMMSRCMAQFQARADSSA